MHFKVVTRINPLERTSPPKHYPCPVWAEEVTIRMISEDISKSCTLTTTDIMAVIESLSERLPFYLVNGHSVRLGDFGIFKISFRSDGKDTEKEVTSSSIKNIKILFRPGTLLKDRLSKTTFTKR